MTKKSNPAQYPLHGETITGFYAIQALTITAQQPKATTCIVLERAGFGHDNNELILTTTAVAQRIERGATPERPGDYAMLRSAYTAFSNGTIRYEV
jgi:hypothetical protein